ncbi:sensor histidine kinase [Cellulosimicrobium marinum]|uniref:sensor histidine kinase n=1 Tax=Cellulosimicrobium marinum TaxID=1638992 RepID=UPI001E28A9A7|nr:histidine kinase [Cellulosimicrobium marinum]MCB7137159.1 histidine kinase [Cellulosimicrobium marinum]
MGWYARLGQWSEQHRFGVDLVATLVVAVVVVPLSAAFSTYGGAGFTTHYGWGMVWAALLLAPLPWRRTHPVASAVTVFAVALTHLLAGYLLLLPADLAVLVALYSVTVYGPRWAHRTAIVSSLAGALVLGTALGLQSGRLVDLATMVFFTTAFGSVTFLAVWAFGLVRRSRRETIAALVDRAERLEVERDQQARIATAAERARIAREMHDIVAHSLSVVIAQADGGRYAAAHDPAAAQRALATVSETGRAALADMRRLLGVLRAEAPRPAPDLAGPNGSPPGALPGSAPGGPPGSPPRAVGHAGSPNGAPVPDALERAPQPDTADLETLVAQVRDSGLRVSLVRVGQPRPLPPGVGLTVYRVCQEALTNVLKHAGPDPKVTVVVRWGPTTLDLEVDDDGRGAAAQPSPRPGEGARPGDAVRHGEPSAPGGFGLLGMRERAALFGGRVAVGPRPGGGFRVHLTLPVPGAPAPGSPAPSGALPAAPTAPTAPARTEAPSTDHAPTEHAPNDRTP